MMEILGMLQNDNLKQLEITLCVLVPSSATCCRDTVGIRGLDDFHFE
jgi:hypothetical protein